MDKAYDHHQHEDQMYKLWEDSGAFTPDSRPTTTGKPFSIIMPPPNANDPLHIGHAMFIALEDILIRYHRMKGDDTVWIPGTDHAGIETQFVFEKKLAKHGKSRFNFDRQTLYDMIWEYVQENSGVAVNQMKKLGASADWSRFRFTLDPQMVKFVNQTFQKLHAEGLIYRDLRLVNYCTKCGTSYSELEVNHIERVSPLYYVKYRLSADPTQYLTVATTRPEPIFADTHLAVHPDNPKTQHLIDQKVLNPLTDVEMDIIADEFVDPEFGTGIVKLTPAHDFTDFDVAQKHHLPLVQAVTLHGKLVDSAPLDLAGLKVEAARVKVVEILQNKGLIEKIDEKYQNRVGTCYRCGRTLEPLPLPQFFIKVKPLADQALAALDSGETQIHGAGRDKILRHWLENLKDWNISRQIVWGIRIPVWYSIEKNPELTVRFIDKNGETLSGKIGELLSSHSFDEISKGLQQLHAPATAEFAIAMDAQDLQSGDYLQETDTFDTWFSSGQWPVVTLKTQSSEDKIGKESLNMDNPDDFRRFYPTTVMETGYDILPFWVMRMMLLGIHLTGQSPFEQVYLHGLVRDEKGQKMSKSKGNVINPLEFVEKYGADALRMALVMSSTPGSDSAVGEAKVKGMRNFSNKIWNAARFVTMQTQENDDPQKPRDAEFRAHVLEVVKQVSQHLDRLRIGQAAEIVHHEFWHWFCDEMIEAYKRGEISLAVLASGLRQFLILLHPFMPFVTEAIWQEIHPAEQNATLILQPW